MESLQINRVSDKTEYKDRKGKDGVVDIWIHKLPEKRKTDLVNHINRY